jgi:soluble lytic murein transglycosylase
MLVINLRRLRLLFIILLILIGVVYLLQAKWFWRVFYPWPYQQEMVQAGVENGVDPFLLAAITRVESGFNPQARSDVGAIGLMQVMPETASWAAQQMNYSGFQPDLLYQPDVNLSIGSWYLSDLLAQFEGDIVVALAAYNAGRGNVSQWIETGKWQGTIQDINSIPFPETRAYIKSVRKHYEIYRYLYN